jgi:hypothetical protein
MCTQRWEANDRLYSVLGYYSRLVKSEKRHLLGEDRLEALSRISVEGLHPSVWDAIGAVQLWWDSMYAAKFMETGKYLALIDFKLAEREYNGHHKTELFSVTLEEWEK